MDAVSSLGKNYQGGPGNVAENYHFLCKQSREFNLYGSLHVLWCCAVVVTAHYGLWLCQSRCLSTYQSDSYSAIISLSSQALHTRNTVEVIGLPLCSPSVSTQHSLVNFMHHSNTFHSCYCLAHLGEIPWLAHRESDPSL